MNNFQNQHAESFTKWIFRRADNLDQIAFFFLSKKNAQNARHFQLFEASTSIRIVFFQGLNIAYTDRIFLVVFRILLHFLKHKTKQYKILHLFSFQSINGNQVQILHIDDPTYSELELDKILRWERVLRKKRGTSLVVCTNLYSKKWFDDNLKFSEVLLIEQGYTNILPDQTKKFSGFSCVYTSPYIHIAGDKHGTHSTWGAEVLIKEIIPRLNLLDSSIKVHLIGELGKNAQRALSTYSNIYTYGRVDFARNIEIISRCSIGIYPRYFDHKRSILKIFTYMGCNLPVVTFDLIDTSIVKDLNIGIAVNNIDQFVTAIKKLKDSKIFYNNFVSKIHESKKSYSWNYLAIKMEESINKSLQNSS